MASTADPTADPLYLATAPPLDPAWLQHEEEAGLNKPKPQITPLERQPIYAAECRALTARMMAPGARDHHLAHGIAKIEFTVPSSKDGFPIPVIRYELHQHQHHQLQHHQTEPPPGPGDEQPGPPEIPPSKRTVALYIHGGGLFVGEADSEELSIRRILKEAGAATTQQHQQHLTIFSVGYRLMPQYSATQSLSDTRDVFDFARSNAAEGTRFVLIGSSSGGELAALVAQGAPRGSVQGVVLRGPVTSAAFQGEEYVPERWRGLHTSARELSFRTSLLGEMVREVPRDGLEKMPLEAGEEELRGLPRTWIQVCTNDVLYSDGVCYARALQAVGLEVQVDVVRGWPHTFWLKAPQLERALEAERAMVKGFDWVLE